MAIPVRPLRHIHRYGRMFTTSPCWTESLAMKKRTISQPASSANHPSRSGRLPRRAQFQLRKSEPCRNESPLREHSPEVALNRTKQNSTQLVAGLQATPYSRDPTDETLHDSNSGA